MSTIKVQNIQHTASSTNAISLASDGTCSANLSNRQGRNLVVNGGMQCFQRGSSFTLSGSDNNEYTVDRFQHNVTTGASFASTHTISDDHPDGFSKSLLISPTATNTPTGGGNAAIRTKLEGQNLQSLAHGTSAAKKITLSFYAKSSSQNNGHQYSVQLRKFPSSDASSRPTVTRAFTVTTSWQRFSFTIIGDTSAGIRNNNLVGMEIVWILASGSDDIRSEYTTWTNDNAFRAVTGQSNFLDNTSNEFYITGVQLEISDHATEFEFEPYSTTFLKCQRYYQTLYDSRIQKGTYWGTGYYYSSTIMNIIERFHIEMRATPTLTCTSGTNFYRLYRHNTLDYVDDFVLTQATRKAFRIANSTDASGTQGSTGGFYNPSTETDLKIIAFSAEL